jgi:hypothetical protein
MDTELPEAATASLPFLQDALPEKMLEKGIKVSGLDLGEMRWVCHNDISREDLDYAVDCLKEILA